MAVKVMKFGGGCLHDVRSLEQVVRIIKNELMLPVIVVSALYDITRKLREGMDICLDSYDNIPVLIKELSVIHENILRQSIDCKEVVRIALDGINTKLLNLEGLYKGLFFTQEVTPSLKALILSFGERLSAQVISSVLNY